MRIDVERLNAPGHNPFAQLIGVRFTKCENGACSGEVEVRTEHFHSGGIVHGGVAFALADSTMATGLITGLERGQRASTIELKISYLAPVVEGTMRCDSWTVRKGRRIAFTESRIYSGEKLVATATASFAILDGEG